MARAFPMDKKPVNLAVLFADITGSTRLYEKLGNARALECVGLCLNIMRESALGCGGRGGPTNGGGGVCVVSTALAPPQAALQKQWQGGMDETPARQRPLIPNRLALCPVPRDGPDRV